MPVDSFVRAEDLLFFSRRRHQSTVIFGVARPRGDCVTEYEYRDVRLGATCVFPRDNRARLDFTPGLESAWWKYTAGRRACQFGGRRDATRPLIPGLLFLSTSPLAQAPVMGSPSRCVRNGVRSYQSFLQSVKQDSRGCSLIPTLLALYSQKSMNNGDGAADSPINICTR